MFLLMETEQRWRIKDPLNAGMRHPIATVMVCVIRLRYGTPAVVFLPKPPVLRRIVARNPIGERRSFGEI